MGIGIESIETERAGRNETGSARGRELAEGAAKRVSDAKTKEIGGIERHHLRISA